MSSEDPSEGGSGDISPGCIKILSWQFIANEVSVWVHITIKINKLLLPE